MIMGDFNGHLGQHEYMGISGIYPGWNRNGKMVAEFAHMNELQVCNNMPEAIGKWTWQQGERRGMSDLILTPKTRKQIAEKVTYDEAQFGFPSDHNLVAISITGKGQHRQEERDSSWGWNIREETEWGKFQEDLTRPLVEWQTK